MKFPLFYGIYRPRGYNSTAMMTNMRKKLFLHLLTTGLGLLLLSSLPVAAVEIPVLHDLPADGQASQQKKLPIVVLFSAAHCGFCSVVKEDFLKPMLISGEYTNKALIRVIEIDSSQDLVDLDGKPISSEAFADRYGIYLTPTLTFLDGEGKELASRMVGLTTVDFYGGYLDTAIDDSRRRLQANR